jgi:hypothetical protein
MKGSDVKETDETKPTASLGENEDDEVEDEKLDEEEKKKKARLRTRGPYRKAHVDW